MFKLILSKLFACVLLASNLVFASEQAQAKTYPFVVGVFHVDTPEVEHRYLRAFKTDIMCKFDGQKTLVPEDYIINATDSFEQAHDKWFAVCELFRKAKR